MSKNDYQDWSKEKLLHEYGKLLKRKKFGIVWDDKTEEVAERCKISLPVLKDEKTKSFSVDKNGINHIFIEGDNYHTLSVLNYTHKKKIDVIYIDPPYNTGNKSWKYNNNYIEKDDRYKHSKWLSFMSKRLRLAKNLLTDEGIILVTIDDHEMFTLGLLMNEIFEENNHLGTICIVNKADGRSDDKFIATAHEYMLVYAKNSDKAVINNLPLSDEEINKIYPLTDNVSGYKLKPAMSGGVASLKTDRPNLFFPIYYNPETSMFSINKKQDYVQILPIDNKATERRWSFGKDKFIQRINNSELICKKSKNTDNYIIFRKVRAKNETKTKSFWYKPEYNSAAHGTKLIESILGLNRAFEYPKSLYAVIDSLIVSSKKNSIVLDFFAGSGTTGHAVLELNKKDGGRRQFILCTDNQDNNGSGISIATDICYPRIRNVMTGYSVGNKNILGLGGNLRYYKTAFVDNIKTDNDKRVLTSQCAEMLCLAETTFNEVANKQGLFAIYENQKLITGIVFDEDAITDFKKEVSKYNKPVVVYVFSYDHTYNKEEFEDIDNLKDVKPIPEVILNVYRKIYKELYKPRNL